MQVITQFLCTKEVSSGFLSNQPTEQTSSLILTLAVAGRPASQPELHPTQGCPTQDICLLTHSKLQVAQWGCLDMYLQNSRCKLELLAVAQVCEFGSSIIVAVPSPHPVLPSSHLPHLPRKAPILYKIQSYLLPSMACLGRCHCLHQPCIPSTDKRTLCHICDSNESIQAAQGTFLIVPQEVDRLKIGTSRTISKFSIE